MKVRRTLLGVFATIIGIPIIYAAFLLLVVGPVDTSPENCIKVSGIVTKIFEEGTKDVAIRLKGIPYCYSINRGLERGLDLDTLRYELLGEEIKFWHAKSWPFKGGHIVHLVYAGEVFYSEWDKMILTKPINREELPMD